VGLFVDIAEKQLQFLNEIAKRDGFEPRHSSTIRSQRNHGWLLRSLVEDGHMYKMRLIKIKWYPRVVSAATIAIKH